MDKDIAYWKLKGTERHFESYMEAKALRDLLTKKPAIQGFNRSGKLVREYG